MSILEEGKKEKEEDLVVPNFNFFVRTNSVDDLSERIVGDGSDHTIMCITIIGKTKLECHFSRN